MDGGQPTEWRRHDADVARLLAAGLALGVLLLFTASDPDALTNLSQDLVRFVQRLPAPIRALLAGSLQLVAVAAPIAGLAWAAWRRAWRAAGVAAAAGAGAAVAMALLTDWLDRVAPPIVDQRADIESWLTGQAFPSAAYLAALAAVAVVISPLLPRRWRRTLWIGVALAAFVRLATAAAVPVNVGVAVVLGAVVGSTVLVIFGAPVTRLSPRAIQAALTRAGAATDRLELLEGGTRRAFLAEATGGERLYVAFIGRDERDADLLVRVWRRLRVRGLEDELGGIQPRQQVRQEALATLMAAEGGAAVPAVRAVGETEEEDGLLALSYVGGTPLAELPAGEITDELLRAVWSEAEHLHRRRIAHRRLGTNQVVVAADGSPTIIGLRWSQVGADEMLLAADVAELLASSALLVGPERAVAAAMAAMGRDRIAAALPLLQPLALSPDTRKAVRKQKGLLDQVREHAQEATGASEVELFPLERIGIAQIVTSVGFIFLALVVVGFVSNWSDISAALRGADWTRVPILVALAGLTYVGGALSLQGAVVRRLPVGRTTTVMFAQAFLNRFTPMNAGGMAMRVRYLQKGGTDVALAATAVGVTSAASGIVQVVLILLFAFWAGDSPGGAISLPDVDLVAVVVLGVAALGALVLMVPALRRFLVRWARLGWARLGGDLSTLAGRPDRLGLLFGGAAFSKLLTIAAFIVSCRAVDIDLGTADLGMLYLVGSSVGAAVPSPGGVGGVEAALIAVLTGAGADSASAAAAVVLFRLVTYWLPVLPGYICLRYSRTAELV